MKTFKVDLHIHTKLSPCGSEEMTPRGISQTARDVGLDIIAICDHNSSRNSAAVIDAARRQSVVAIPGIELETRERIHVVGLFPTVMQALWVGEAVRQSLPDADEAYADHIGRQILLDADDQVWGTEEKALAAPSSYDLRSTVELIHTHGGLAIAAHVERPSFSVYSQLGDVPRDIAFDALEVSPANSRPIGLREKFGRYGYPLIASSDSHYLIELGRACSNFVLDHPCFEEIGLALHRQEGRSVSIA